MELQRDLTDIIREDEESFEYEACLCRVGTERDGTVVIISEHCPLHSEDDGMTPSEIAQAEVEAFERRLANAD